MAGGKWLMRHGGRWNACLSYQIDVSPRLEFGDDTGWEDFITSFRQAILVRRVRNNDPSGYSTRSLGSPRKSDWVGKPTMFTD